MCSIEQDDEKKKYSFHICERKISRGLGFFFFTRNAIISILESPKMLLLRNQQSVLENTLCA